MEGRLVGGRRHTTVPASVWLCVTEVVPDETRQGSVSLSIGENRAWRETESAHVVFLCAGSSMPVIKPVPFLSSPLPAVL